MKHHVPPPRPLFRLTPSPLSNLVNVLSFLLICLTGMFIPNFILLVYHTDTILPGRTSCPWFMFMVHTERGVYFSLPPESDRQCSGSIYPLGSRISRVRNLFITRILLGSASVVPLQTSTKASSLNKAHRLRRQYPVDEKKLSCQASLSPSRSS